MRWWPGPSSGRRRAAESVSSGVLWQDRRENGAWWFLVLLLLSPQNSIKVFVSVSQLWVAAIACVKKKEEKSTVFPVVVHCLGSEVDWSTLCREWGIKGFITPWPAGLTPAPLWLWRGSERSAAAGWSWIWPPGDWAGCGWNNRGGRPGRRWWAPPPHDPGRRSEGRSHRETRPGCCKRCSHATGIPTALETGNGLITDASSQRTEKGDYLKINNTYSPPHLQSTWHVNHNSDHHTSCFLWLGKLV